MEELALTDPVVVPEKTTTTYRVSSILLDMDTISMSGYPSPAGEPGLIVIELRDNLGQPLSHRYEGEVATTMIRTLNTANLTTKSLHKRILERLSLDGVIPGTVTGTPDPVTP